MDDPLNFCFLVNLLIRNVKMNIFIGLILLKIECVISFGKIKHTVRNMIVFSDRNKIKNSYNKLL